MSFIRAQISACQDRFIDMHSFLRNNCLQK
nr:MAG TPA: hypothetical protein [Caudoviricetes sp.]